MNLYGQDMDRSSSPLDSGLGWTVDLARFDDALINAHRARAPAVTVRIKLDRS